MIGHKRHIRSDLINPTTLPTDIGMKYMEHGGPGFDPVLSMVIGGQNQFSLDIQTVLDSRKPQFRKNGFLQALLDIGMQKITFCSIPNGEIVGHLVLTIVHAEDHPHATKFEANILEYLRALLRALRKHGHLARYFGIKPKELHTLTRIANGLSSNEVAQESEVTLRAIETRLQNIRKKLRARTTPEAIYKATAYGMI